MPLPCEHVHLAPQYPFMTLFTLSGGNGNGIGPTWTPPYVCIKYIHDNTFTIATAMWIPHLIEIYPFIGNDTVAVVVTQCERGFNGIKIMKNISLPSPTF